MDVTKTMGELYRYADTLPEGKDKWLVELAATCLEHTHFYMEGNREDVLLHVVDDEHYTD